MVERYSGSRLQPLSTREIDRLTERAMKDIQCDPALPLPVKDDKVIHERATVSVPSPPARGQMRTPSFIASNTKAFTAAVRGYSSMRANCRGIQSR
ncbi:MAG: hypothetical protein R2758_09660 [Bacteroidales bacterium]